MIKPNLQIYKVGITLKVYKEIIALTKRLYIQIYRRPSTLFAGIIQPLLWLVLFGELFKNAPINMLKCNIAYGAFLTPGIVVFTAFTGSMNAGLPIIFDREFGFLNRLLVSPLKNRNSLLLSCLIYIWTITILQIIIIISCSTFIFNSITLIQNIPYIISLTSLLIINIASASICLAFLLPGHIEFLAFMVITNLPVLFSSTALAPLSFMPYWLQMIACLNPLTYAIEIIRYICTRNLNETNNTIIETVWFNLSLTNSIDLLIIINIFSFIIAQYIIRNKYE
uniref:ABC transmembrane type-2 domain-containing protein n=1 Tax=Plumaria plumosa TaxID=189642 RepID=A0A4D6WZA1_9FLOR|nr:hypothetical protein [Plumaria plumosa]